MGVITGTRVCIDENSEFISEFLLFSKVPVESLKSFLENLMVLMRITFLHVVNIVMQRVQSHFRPSPVYVMGILNGKKAYFALLIIPIYLSAVVLNTLLLNGYLVAVITQQYFGDFTKDCGLFHFLRILEFQREPCV